MEEEMSKLTCIHCKKPITGPVYWDDGFVCDVCWELKQEWEEMDSIGIKASDNLG